MRAFSLAATLAVALLAGDIVPDDAPIAKKGKKRKADVPLTDDIVAHVEGIAVGGSTGVGFALLVAGMLGGYGWWYAQNGRPRRLVDGTASKDETARIASLAMAALETRNHAKSGLGSDELADVQLFYEKWLNLEADDRDAMREELRAAGVDMIKLGDVIRSIKSAVARG